MTVGPHADMPGGDDRSVIELEFVQSLANPDYVSHLLQLHGEDEHFWRFLHYLQYWQRPVYPLCLFMLELLLKAGDAAKKNAGALVKQQVVAHYAYQTRL